MFRPITILGPVLALALAALSACSDAPARRSGPAAGGPAPTASTAAPGTATPGTVNQGAARSTPAPAPGQGGDDQSLRLGGGTDTGDSCRAQCERSNNSCMDSVAARTQSGAERPDRLAPFTPTDNCQYSLRQCFQRCGSTR